MRTTGQTEALLESLFVGKQAICVEHGAMLVQLVAIRVDATRQFVDMDLLQVPSPGLPTGLLADGGLASRRVVSLGAGCLSKYTSNRWIMGYGGWCLYFDPELVAGAVQLAASFQPEERPMMRQRRLQRWISDWNRDLPTESWQSVFKEEVLR
jgi:hypothetical protein